MDRLKVLLAIIIAMGISFVSCSEDDGDDFPWIEIYASDITIKASGNADQEISFVTTDNWTAEVKYANEGDNWITITPKAGNAGEKSTILLKFADSKSKKERKGYIHISFADEVKIIEVAQEPVPADIKITPTEFTFDAVGSTPTEVNFKVNADWKMAIKYDKAIVEGGEWVSVGPVLPEDAFNEVGDDATVLTDAKLTLEMIKDNDSFEDRKATITITYGNKTQELKITQKGIEPEIQSETTELDFVATGSTPQEVDFKVNGDWETSVIYDGEAANWLTVTPSEGEGSENGPSEFVDGKIEVKATNNLSTVGRTATVVITCNGKEYAITVNQAGV